MFLKKVDGVIGSLLARVWPRPRQSGAPLSHGSSLLLIRPGGIGDAVLVAPAIRRLRQIYPMARIEVLAEKCNAGAFALCSGIDRVLCYDKPRNLWQSLKSSYDMVVDTEQWHRLSAIVACMIHSKVKIGYGTNGRKRLFTHPISYGHENYEIDSFFELLKPLELEPPTTIPYPFLSIHAVDQDAADSRLGTFLDKSFISLFPGASIPERCWGVEKFHQLANRLMDEGIAVVVVDGKEDIAAVSFIAEGLSALNLTGKTSLGGTAGILNRSQLLISGDSGVLHIGVGLGTPTFSLFGPGISDKWAPCGKQHFVINHKLPCSLCTKFGSIPPCPIGVRCMQDISVTEVFMAAQKLLSSNKIKVDPDAV